MRWRTTSAAADAGCWRRLELSLGKHDPHERRLRRDVVRTRAADVRFPEATGLSLKQVWQISPGRRRSRTALAGVEPAALFESRDGGESWNARRGSVTHPHRPQWQPGGGGLCLHTIVPDPRTLEAHARRDLDRRRLPHRRRRHDWRARNEGVRARVPARTSTPSSASACTRSCTIRAARSGCSCRTTGASTAATTAGDSWHDIANGVPSDFGFAMPMHPHDPDTVYIVPLESDEFRCTPEAKLRVYRTRDAGESWEPLESGLPQKDAFETVLRDAMSRGLARSGRRLLRHAQRQALRLGRRRRLVDSRGRRCRRSSAYARWSSAPPARQRRPDRGTMSIAVVLPRALSRTRGGTASRRSRIPARPSPTRCPSSDRGGRACSTA